MSKKKAERPEPASLGLPRVGVESHAHLDGEGFSPDEIPAILERAAGAGIAQVGNVYLGPAAYAAGRGLFAGHPEVFGILGQHPCDAATAEPGDVAVMEAAFRADDNLKAVGEIGLDYYWDATTAEAQKRLFRDQLALARELALPAVIHSRDAAADTLAILDDLGLAGRPLVWHCFGGDAALAREIARRGFYLSIPGPVTYRKNTALAEAVAGLDLTRLLLETDAPYLTPEPWRGKRNEPAYTVFTVRAMAEARGENPEDLWRTCGENARRFFGL